MYYFTELNIESKISQNILDKIDHINESEWIQYLEQSIYLLKITDFEPDPDIVDLINKFGSEKKLSLFRLPPKICYSWHRDAKRQASINMLIKGFNSICVFGTEAPEKKFINLDKIEHKKNRYYLMNVKESHTVFNFDQERYVVSISIPDTPYEIVRDYLINRSSIVLSKSV
jgi:hypothetical protein